MGTENDLTITLSIVSSLGFLFLAILQWRNQARSSTAEAAENIGAAYSHLLRDMKARVDDLEKAEKTMDKRVNDLETELRLCMKWNTRLISQLAAAGIEPADRPTDPRMKALKE